MMKKKNQKEKRRKTENEVNKLQSIIFRFDAFFLLLYADRMVENLLEHEREREGGRNLSLSME